MKLSLFWSACALILFSISCRDRDDYKTVPEQVEGFRPVYFDTTTDIMSLVFSAPPKAVQAAGKIYLYKQYLFVGETAKGVHVFDNTDPANPVAKAFINIPYNFDIAVKDSTLYADTYMGLVVIDISKLPDIKVLSFIRSLSNDKAGVPPLPVDRNGFNGRFNRAFRTYFECIDTRKGVIVGWESATLQKPKCYQ